MRTREVFIRLPFHIVYGGIFVVEWDIRLYFNGSSLTASFQYVGDGFG